MKSQKTQTSVESLPVWSLVIRLTQVAGSEAKTPSGKIRAALSWSRKNLSMSRPLALHISRVAVTGAPAVAHVWESGALTASVVRSGHACSPRTFSDSERADRRAKNDPKFRRALKRQRANETRRRDLVMHIAERWHATVGSLYTSKYASIIYGNAYERVEWDRYAKSYKYPCKYSVAGVRIEGTQIIIESSRGNEIPLPLPPAALIRAAALTEPHPTGLFAVPVTGQSGVFAMMGLDKPRTKWVVVGFCSRGRIVPECVARGTITSADIDAETNVETRAIMLEIFGAERYIREIGATEIDHSDLGTLFDAKGLKILKVVNATAEPDGTYKDYYLRVPPHTETARAAVAWTFGLKEEEYAPSAQS